jgi:hypothetical protein
MATEKVKAVAGFRSANGNRERGDVFDYDLHRDPDDLKRLGLVESVEKPAAEPAAKAKK